MELTLKRLLEQATFTKSRGRYDAQEVDELLDRAVAMATKVEARLNQAIQEADAASGPSPEEIEARVEELVHQRLNEAGAAGQDAAEEAVRTIRIAQRTADEAIREAQEEAAALRTAAQEEAEALTAEARAEAERLDALNAERAAKLAASIEAETGEERAIARAALAAEIAEIEAARDALRADVEALEEHLALQRTQVELAVAEIQRLLDDPSGFQVLAAPSLNDPEIPDLTPRPAAAEVAEPAEESTPEPDPDEVADAADVVDDAPEPGEPVDTAGAAEAFPLTFDEIDHEAPGVDDLPDGGPPTAPISVIDLDAAERAGAAGEGDEEHDPFLAELRKAMEDEEPLGPREHDDAATGDPFLDDDRRSWRFGKRRP